MSPGSVSGSAAVAGGAPTGPTTGDSVVASSLGLPGPPLPATLPPMSSFRGGTTASGGAGTGSPASILYTSHSPVVQTSGDTLGKALASVSFVFIINYF